MKNLFSFIKENKKTYLKFIKHNKNNELVEIYMKIFKIKIGEIFKIV
jgi:hypothetical protein